MGGGEIKKPLGQTTYGVKRKGCKDISKEIQGGVFKGKKGNVEKDKSERCKKEKRVSQELGDMLGNRGGNGGFEYWGSRQKRKRQAL